MATVKNMIWHEDGTHEIAEEEYIPEPTPEDPEPKLTVEDRLTALEAEAEQAKADREALNILLGGAE